jgi:phage terminase large subunit-like protein
VSTEPPRPPPGAAALGAWFDTAAADAACDFFPTYLRLTKAEWYGRPFHLAPWQARDIIRPLFGWKRADGTRLYRRMYLEVPRKNGKTELAAGIAWLCLVGDGEAGAEGYSMAVTADQAKIVFEKAITMGALSPTLAGLHEAYKTSIFVPELLGSFKPLSARPGGKHGFNPSFAIGDEMHEWPDGELHDVVHKGTAARRQPLEILITTAGVPGIGYGWELHEHATEVLSGNREDPSLLPVIYAADAEDDWKSPDTWRKANPNFGDSVKPEYLASEVANAIGKTRKEGEFKRFHLNIWNSDTAEGIPMEEWDACNHRPVTLATLAGRRAYAGLDLAATTDLNALVAVAPWENGKGLDVWARFWLPVKSPQHLAERCKRDRVPFDQWIAEGWIVATDGDVSDYDAIRAAISGAVPHPAHTGPCLAEACHLVDIGVDRWGATQLNTQLQGDGIPVVLFGQGTASMSAPSKELLRLVRAGALNHGGNPVLRWMAQCVSFAADGADNLKPVKPDRRKVPKRIDGIVATCMAIGRQMAQPAPAVSFWEVA